MTAAVEKPIDRLSVYNYKTTVALECIDFRFANLYQHLSSGIGVMSLNELIRLGWWGLSRDGSRGIAMTEITEEFRLAWSGDVSVDDQCTDGQSSHQPITISHRPTVTSAAINDNDNRYAAVIRFDLHSTVVRRPQWRNVTHQCPLTS